MRRLKIVADITFFLFSGASPRLYRCDTAAFSTSESETILNGFLKDVSGSPVLNLDTCNSRVEFFSQIGQWVG